MRGQRRGLGSVAGSDVVALYLFDSAENERVCATAAVTGVRCCEFAKRLVQEQLFPS